VRGPRPQPSTPRQYVRGDHRQRGACPASSEGQKGRNVPQARALPWRIFWACRGDCQRLRGLNRPIEGKTRRVLLEGLHRPTLALCLGSDRGLHPDVNRLNVGERPTGLLHVGPEGNFVKAPILIQESVRKLIADHIDSVEQLEVLLLLRAQRERVWTVGEINDEIKSSVSSVEARLSDLADRGLLERQGRTFRYQATPEMDATVTELARAYAERRFTVIELIFAKPTDKLRAFADAFKMSKKRGPDG
jgi:hypothetical protein